MIPKDLEQITEKDLQNLIDDSVLENKTIEYKRSLPGKSHHEKVEFLADISSFANASGGNIVYGIVQNNETGKPTKLEGLNVENMDKEILRLENIIRDGIGPRIIEIKSKHIDLLNSKKVLIIRVPKGLRKPYRVTFEGHDKFYKRSSNGKHPLDVEELRVEFNSPKTITEKMKKFRESRISKILTNDTSAHHYDGAKVVLHLLPVISFDSARQYSIENKKKWLTEKMRPINSAECKGRYNLDGFLTYSENGEKKSYSCVQLFKNGIIEAINENERIFNQYFEVKIIKVLGNYLSILKTLNIELPIFIFLTLTGVKGYIMHLESFCEEGKTPIDRDILLLPKVLAENYNIHPENILKPCFDLIYNACGLPGSSNYDSDGQWSGQLLKYNDY